MARLGIPDLKRFITTPTQNAFSVRAETDTNNSIRMASEGQRFHARLGIPNLDCRVATSTDEPISVRAKTGAMDIT